MGYIGLQGILQLLHVVKGPSGNGEYLAKCPSHDDRQASLCVREGDKGILLKCQAGCSANAICSRLGIEMKDLFKENNYKSSSNRKPNAKKAEPKGDMPKITEIKQYKSFEDAFGHIGSIEKVYNYTDETGKLRFSVVRIMPKDGKKTFRQCRPAEASVDGFPIVTGVPMEVRNGILYRLPRVKAAIRQGAVVYVVEGEKDVETLEAMRLVATTSPMGADHWTKAHGEQLRGANVVIVPDNDEPGRKYGEEVAKTLKGVAESVRIVHLVDGYGELPEHGDISDLAKLIGERQAQAMLLQLTREAEEIRLSPYEIACEVFNGINGYGAIEEKGCIVRHGDKGMRELSSFVALPVCEVTKDDGVTSSKLLEIDGWTAGGRALPRLSVPIAKYSAMSWAMEGWGLVANIMPGNAVKDQLRSVIAAAGAKMASQRTIYTHTGWRQISGKWVYLYQGGCIGAKGVSVDMGAGLEAYSLSEVAEISAADAALDSFGISGVLADRVAIPLLGVTFLAPLREFLNRAKCPPAFITFLKGASSTQKSTAASLFLSFFGNFHNKSMPANFGDTSNYIRHKAFSVKDMLLVIDDYHPQTSIQERRKMEATAQSLSRAFGDLAERGRMSADLSLQPSKPPRCLALMTGEQLPDIGPSGVNRFYTIDVSQGDIPRSDALTELQKKARDGVFRKCMSGYIEWLLPQADRLSDALGNVFMDYRSRATKRMAGQGIHGRTVEAIAQIMIGLTVMMHYFEYVGAVDHDLAADMIEMYWDVVAGNSAAQNEASKEDSPSELFIRAVREMLVSKVMTVVDCQPGMELKRADKGMVGYVDQEYFYLMGETVFGFVVRFYRDQDRVFPLNRAATYKLLKEEKIIEVAADGKTGRVKRIGGTVGRYLWIPRWRITGDKPKAESRQMNFTELSDAEIPEEFK